MKKISLALTGLAVCALFCTAAANPPGNKTLPKSVSSAFSRQYPRATMIDWQYRNDHYIVNFSRSTAKSAAYFTRGGTWLRTDTKVTDKTDLPGAVQNGLSRSRYGRYSVEKIEKISQPAGETEYMMVVDYGGDIDWDLWDEFTNERLLVFDSSGHLRQVMGSSDKMAPKGFAMK